MRTLLKDGIIVTKNERDSVLNLGWLLINGNLIENIGLDSPPVDVDNTFDLKGNIVLPGFINCHTHFSQTLLRGYSENYVLEEWLNKVIRPFQNNITEEQVSLSTELSVAENIRFGVTTVIQHHKLADPEFIDIVHEIVKERGLRMVFMIGCNDRIVSCYPSVDHFKDFVIHKGRLWNDEYFSMGVGPTSLRNCSPELISGISELSEKYDMAIHVHIAETKKEVTDTIEKYGLTPVRRLDKLGLLKKQTQLVHCVYVDEYEMDAIKASGGHVVHCPVSNLYLRDASTLIDKMLVKNIPVVIGSDGSASSLSQDVLGNVKIASLFLKASGIDGRLTSASRALYMVTRWAAQMLGRDDIGQLTPGAKADLVVIDTKSIRQQPIYDPQITVVYNTVCKDILMVMVDGNILLKDGELINIDEESLLMRANKFTIKSETMS